jgi:hypothetical protein
VPTFVDRGCHVVGVKDPYGRILGFLNRSLYLLEKDIRKNERLQNVVMILAYVSVVLKTEHITSKEKK